MECPTLDQWMAPRLVPSPPESTHLVQRLIRSFLDGHLCLRLEEEPVLPEALVSHGGECPETPFVRDGNRLYLQKAWVLETRILREIQRLKNRLIVITGGPGTGKTFTAGELVRQMSPKRLVAAAPTGKAASRLSEGIGGVATTLHRLLRLYPGQERLFSEEKIEADLIVVDEASMIDVSLLAHLLSAIPDGATLILLGDADQLPPVEGGSLFRELASLFGKRLEKVMRTDRVELLSMAKAIREGVDADLSLHPLPSSPPFRFLHGKGEMPAPEGWSKVLQEHALLSCLRQGPWGVDALNARAMAMLTRRLTFGDWWAIPLLIVQNEPRLDLYNGMMGMRVGRYRGRRISRGEGVAYIAGQTIAASLLPVYEEGFALSVHKSQGSEFDAVDLFVPPGSERFGREALYTGVTRARQKIQIWGEKETVNTMMGRRFLTESGFRERWQQDAT